MRCLVFIFYGLEGEGEINVFEEVKSMLSINKFNHLFEILNFCGSKDQIDPEDSDENRFVLVIDIYF